MDSAGQSASSSMLGTPISTTPEEVHPNHASAATLTTELQPPARSRLLPEVAQNAPYLSSGHTPSTSSSSLPSSANVGASTSAPSLFAFFSHLALHGGESGKEGKHRGGGHGSMEGVESGGMSEEEFSDSSDTEEGRFSSFSDLPTPSGTTDNEDEGDLAPLPDEQSLKKHHVFPPPPSRQDSSGSINISTRLAQLAVSNLANLSQESFTTTKVDHDAKWDDGWTDEDKLAAIKDEFGEFRRPMQQGDYHGSEEKFLAEATGGLFRGILIIGNLLLTTHRLCFLARLPPLSDHSASAGHLLKSGAVYILKSKTRLGVSCTRKKRVWLELSADMATTYPDSTEAGRTRPLKTILLSTVKRIKEETDDRVIEIELYTPRGATPDIRRLEFDTRESCLAWRRAFEAALFHFDRQRRLLVRRQISSEVDDAGNAPSPSEEWERVRISLPLERIEQEQSSGYMEFATIVDLHVNNTLNPSAVADTFSTSNSDQESIETKSPPHTSQPLPVTTELGQSSSVANVLHIQFALLSHQQPFVHAFEAARTNALKQAEYCGAKRSSCPPPLVDLEDAFRDYLLRGEDGDLKLEGEEGAGGGESLANEVLRTVFGLGHSEGLWSIDCGLNRNLIPLKGQLVVSPAYIGFYRRAYAGSDIKFRFKISDIKSATKWSTMHLSTKGMSLNIHGQPSLHLEFFARSNRDLAIEHVNDAVARYALEHPSASRADSSLVPEISPSPTRSSFDSPYDQSNAPSPPGSTPNLLSPTSSGFVSPTGAQGHSRQSSRNNDILLGDLSSPEVVKSGKQFSDAAFNYVPHVVNIPQQMKERTTKQVAPRHFCMLTIGSRGDVQPYIALALGLQKDGHRCTIITHDEFQEWVEGFGIGFRQAGGDPAALMRLSVEHKMFSPGFFKESLGHFRQWLDDLFHDAWVACHDADVLIESPSAMAGIHIAEALKIPYFRAFTMPWTRTHDYPQAFMVPAIEMSGQFYYATYILFDNIIWKATAGQVNRWRRKELGLGPTVMSHLEQSAVPFVYNFSSAVVPPPLDWKDNILISGYWFLPDQPEQQYTPPDDLAAFIQRARDDGKALVYIGFGSIVVPHPGETTRSIIRAVEKAGVRAIVAKGWSGRGQEEVDKDGLPVEIPFPDSCFSLEKVPHDWLFERIDAAVHHGGAGTTGASLRAGIPTIIKPWFGDQYFWALRVQKLGAGIRVNSLSGNELADALVKATTDDLMRETAAKIGEKIRSENGVAKSIEWFYSHLEYGRDRHASTHRTASPHRNSLPPSSSHSSPSGSPKTGSKVLPALGGLGKGIRGFRDAGNAVVSVGRLGSALKGMAKGAGSGTGA